MLLVSFLLVIVATVLLLSGLFLTKDLPLIFLSIGCSALAGLVLVVAVLRSRPRPAAAPGFEGAAPGQAGGTGLAAAPVGQGVGEERLAGREFPIPDYEQLEVVEVLPLLGDLGPGDLEMVRQREASGRAHPWVLARIDALLESEVAEGDWADRWAQAEAEPAWAEPEPELAGGRTGEWAASDFPLESRAETFDEIEIVRGFPIDRYDDLRANDILPLLSDLDAEDLKMVREEEAAGKARTSILSRIDSLLAREQRVPRPAPAKATKATKATKAAQVKAVKAAKAPSKAAVALPIENYDGLTVSEINARLAGLSVAELKQVRTYERRHKARLGVLQRIEGALLRAR